MRFSQTKVNGAYEIEIEPVEDERGFFARTWCEEEFRRQGLNPRLVQCSISFNPKKSTLRGMHYQLAPHAESKLVRCTQGSIYDVILDLRPNSTTFCHWTAVVLTAATRNMAYIPEGCAHGFLTLEHNCEVFYQMSESYHADSARGVRWSDPAFQIQWPAPVQVISDRDRTYPEFRENNELA
jgi:dTDP-4-dehydrorhamnose 3,5-epimerase